ncbi:hypothetical protein [Gordonia soli]|uniref:Uncharacterized protein n=1 Tax=Gordonia soli NBRC 108243 TaxID=1223545 RepID=M0QKN3_9ACTN|nr:hypothetical protein [Gordonia soli]GAC69004.1 hypothetical protein GS4_20_00690 [Gordonia soli NBRC 108243]
MSTPIAGTDLDSLRRIADSLAPDVWPTADVGALMEAAGRLRTLLTRLSEAVAAVGHAQRGADGAGQTHQAMLDHADRVTTSATSAAQRSLSSGWALVEAVERYAATSGLAHEQTAVMAAIADRDRLRGEVLGLLGDDSARVMAASGGRLALTAAGDEYTEQSADDGRHGHDQNSAMPPPAASAGMMPFAALGGAAAGVGALASSLSATDAHTPDGIAAGDVQWLERRAAQLQSSIPPSLAGWVRMAVGLGELSDGARVVIVGTSDPYPYLREGLSLRDSEFLAGNGRSAELAIADQMARSGVEPLAFAAATPMAPETIAALGQTDAELLAPDDLSDPAWSWDASDPGDQ